MAEAIGPGTELGPYRVTGLLGQGGMASVYRAADLRSGEHAAVKVMLPALARNEGFRRRFQRELRYVSSLRHPNIVSVLEVGEAEGRLYLAMQLIQGSDLKAMLGLEGYLDAQQAVSILTQVAAALDAAHAEGITHRDVKPANVLVASGEGPEPGGQTFLVDFGLGKDPRRDSVALTGVGSFVGTVHYTAPEQVLGKQVDSRADVYSLACLLYECLAGEPPFPSLNEAEVLQAHIEDPPPKLSDRRADLPGDIDAVIERGLAKEPGDRSQTASELMADAAQALGVRPQAPEPPPAQPRPPARVSLSVEVDAAAGQAGVRLDRDADVVRLVAEDGRWRFAGE